MSLIWSAHTNSLLSQADDIKAKQIKLAVYNLGDAFVDTYVKLKPILVLDLDETLVHYNFDTNMIYYRPYLDDFLKRLYKLFRICVFTAGTDNHALTTVNAINTMYDFKNGEVIQYIFDRSCMKDYIENDQLVSIKNLFDVNSFILDRHLFGTKLTPLQRYRAINTSVAKTIIIDNININYCNYKGNGINIIDFIDSSYDNALSIIKYFLLEYIESINNDNSTNAYRFIKQNIHLLKSAIQK